MKEVIVIVAKGCPGCEELKKSLEGSKTKFKIMDVTEDLEAARIIRDLGIYKVPLLVTVERTEMGTEFCTLDQEKGDVKCVRASEGES